MKDETLQRSIYFAINISNIGQIDADRRMFFAVVMFVDFQGLFQMIQRFFVMTFLLQKNGEIIFDFSDRRMILSVDRFGVFQRFEIQFFRFSVIALFPMNIFRRRKNR